MRAHVLLYGRVGGVIIAGLRVIEHRWLLVQHSFVIYGGLVAAVFAALGIWLGLKLTRPACSAGAAASRTGSGAAAREVLDREAASWP